MKVRNAVVVGAVYRDLDRRYKGRAADRKVQIVALTSNEFDEWAVCRTFISGRESKKSKINVDRLADPVRFHLVERPAEERFVGED